jgi:hypothetical protein
VRQNQTELPVPPRDSAPAQAILFSSMLQRDYCEKVRAYLMLCTPREFSNRLRAASHDLRINGSRTLFPSVFIILIHYICFSDLARSRRIKDVTFD